MILLAIIGKVATKVNGNKLRLLEGGEFWLGPSQKPSENDEKSSS